MNRIFKTSCIIGLSQLSYATTLYGIEQAKNYHGSFKTPVDIQLTSLNSLKKAENFKMSTQKRVKSNIKITFVNNQYKVLAGPFYNDKELHQFTEEFSPNSTKKIAPKTYEPAVITTFSPKTNLNEDSHTPGNYSLFLSGEGLYAWPNISNFNAEVVNYGTYAAVPDNNGWGGRGAFGFIIPQTINISYGAEIGWGYYGHTNLNTAKYLDSTTSLSTNNNVFNANSDTYAFDTLAGIYYTQPKYELFFKGGAFFENMRITADFTPGFRFPTNLSPAINGSKITLKKNMPQVMPVIKLGGNYHIKENLLLTTSWLHAFGGNLSINATKFNIQQGTFNLGNMQINMLNPTLNTFLLGLEYRFA